VCVLVFVWERSDVICKANILHLFSDSLLNVCAGRFSLSRDQSIAIRKIVGKAHRPVEFQSVHWKVPSWMTWKVAFLHINCWTMVNSFDGNLYWYINLQMIFLSTLSKPFWKSTKTAERGVCYWGTAGLLWCVAMWSAHDRSLRKLALFIPIKVSNQRRSLASRWYFIFWCCRDFYNLVLQVLSLYNDLIYNYKLS
jgi:hypothetical protein